ncbi:transmembrane protein tincar isoform X2 [Leptinotarsa decemlineata]|uniref:transmembrane protein tincar isoform X2 n=1 Tax=Leptinotarsa decemlineata TaxID=7539 RepID=UPI000C2519C3|nr:protein tincar isoform X2 [Leptinotarsa decemlineata]
MHSTPSTPTKFDNNNDIKKSIEKMSDSSKSSYQAIKSTESLPNPKKSKKKCGIHLNNLWSVWYGLFCSVLQGYAARKCLRRILGYSLLSWPGGLPYLELNCSLGLTGAAILLLPVFMYVAILKVGNLANDGYKLGRQMGTCSKEPPEIMKSGAGCGLFRYGGPTAPFIHIAISFCLLIPKLLMEARLIEAGFLSQDWIWHTDLDFIIMHRDRLVVLSFMTANGSNISPTSVMQNRVTATTMATMRASAMPFVSGQEATHTVMKTLKDFIGHENHTMFENKDIESGFGSPISIEYMNLALALIIYSVRYPALFWSTNKCLGLIFSFQLLINGLHTLLSFAGMSILYKVHVVGVWKALPLLKHNSRVYNFGSPTPFLLNSEVTFAMYVLSTLLVLASSIVMYFYGHTRFNAFLNLQRESKIITLKEEGNSNLWSYFTHCAALCVLLSIGICNAPLIHDYTVVYRGSLDDITLICIIGGILHLFFWIVIWLFLTIKQKWTFKLRITIGRATVRESRSLRLVHDVHLNSHREDASQQPLLVIGNGRTYSVTDNSPKRAIMGVIQKAALIKKSKSNGSITTNDDSDEQIYWLRPALVPSQNSPDGSNYFCWFKKKPKHKVTFDDSTTMSTNRVKSSVRRSTIPGLDEDDGDYATLRELPLPPSASQRLSNGDDTASEEGKVQTGAAPRCLRRADSGIIPHEERPGRSDSVSTESSHSPPEGPGSNHSETSSGIHSNDSEHHQSSSKGNLTKEPDWKSSQSDNSQNLINLNDPPGEPQAESTVVIRRKSVRPSKVEVIAPAILEEDPYGRATNMRMTSFTDKTELSHMQSCSATLPHYPTQPMQNVYPNCSTMPLPQHTSSSGPSTTLMNGNSCNIFPRQHSTIPTHHNGVKLITNNHNPYIKRLHSKPGEPIKYEPIYTAINRKSGELYHYTS